MKKILGLVISGIALIAVSLLAYWSFSGDVQALADGQVMQGALDFRINGAKNSVKMLDNLNNVMPGESGSRYVTLKNAGSLQGSLDIQISSVINTGGAGGTRYEDGIGNLGDVAEIAPWIDLDEDAVFDPGLDIALDYNCSVASSALRWNIVNSFSEKSWINVLAGMDSGSQNRFYIAWRIPPEAGNEIQGDSISFDVNFTLKSA
jgi:spore coat-associated protein N